MTATKFRYETPSAFRAALKDRFEKIARADRRYSLHELQRQFAYDRALAKLFSSMDADRWVLKGAGALLARLATARHSKDIDMFFTATHADVDDAVEALQTALRIDIGDHFAFDIIRVAPLQEEAKGARVHVNTRLGPTLFAAFHIDVVVGTVMTGTPDVVASLTPLDIEGLIRPRYRVFPVADHLADKLCATIGTHAGRGRTAVPDPAGWAARYPRVAAESPGPVPDYNTAVSLASKVFDPVLDATATGVWEPSVQVWIPQ